MAPSIHEKKRSSQQRKNLKKIYGFSEEDRHDAILAVQRISQRAMKNILNDNSTRVLDFDNLDNNQKENTHFESQEKSTGVRKRRKNKSSASSSHASIPTGAWMCGVSGKRFNSYEEACQHEDNQIREVVAELGWAQTSLGLEPYQQQEQGRFVSTTEMFNDLNPPSSPSRENTIGVDSVSKLTPSRPDLLTVSRSSRLTSSPNSTRHPPYLPSLRSHQLDRFESFQEYHELSGNDEDDLTSTANNDYVVLADQALADVCRKAQKLALSRQEHKAEFELECYSKDKHYYDMLERREIERQRDGAYSRFRTEGKNLAEKIQNKFVDAYAVMKEGKSETTTTSVDHYKRKLEDPDVQNVIDNTKKTIYVNVIVKNSIQVVRTELDRLARQRWEERQKKEGSMDVRNEESRERFEKFKAAAQGQLVQLAGLALASDFTPRRIAVQLSNDLYRLLTPYVKTFQFWCFSY